MRTTTQLSVLIATALLLIAADAAADDENLIVVEFLAIEHNAGSVVCALFDEGNFLSDSAVQGDEAFIEDGRAICIFEDVGSGRYAVSAYHDENGNGELDTGVFRIPREGYAFSRDARGGFGPPDFEDASFDHVGEITHLRARMDY